jgi:hypothetical protein
MSNSFHVTTLARQLNPLSSLAKDLSALEKRKLANEKLKAESRQIEEELQKLQVIGLSQKHRHGVYEATQKANELLFKFEHECNYCGYRRSNESQVLKECGQEVQLKHLKNADDCPNSESLLEFSTTLQELQEQARHQNHKDIVDALQKCYLLVSQATSHVDDSKLHSNEFVQGTHDILRILKEVISLPPVGNSTVNADEEVRRVAWNIEEVSFAQSNAIADGDIATAEKQYFEKLMLQEKVLGLLMDQFSRLDQEEAMNIASPSTRISNARVHAQQVIECIVEAKDRLQNRCQDDYARLCTELEQAERKHLEATLKFEEDRRQSDLLLERNTQQQTAIWNTIAEMERQLYNLSLERRDEVMHRLAATERHHKKQMDFAGFREIVLRHKDVLALTLLNCKIRQNVADLMQDVSNILCDTIEAQLVKYSEEIETAKRAMHQKYDDNFRLVCGCL